MKQHIKILGGAYLLGVWIYGVWYVWAHWEGATQIGTLMGAGVLRAIAWPFWVAQYLVEA